MPVYKDKERGTYYVSCYTSSHKKKTKRGFKTKKAAMEWEREFELSDHNDLSMTFASFVGAYRNDMLHKIREHTWQTKNAIINSVILPYFGEMQLNSIKSADVIKWQNQVLGYRNEKGEPYSPAYLRTMNSQLSAIFNHAVKYYDLKHNPVVKAGSIGKKDAREMEFWTKEEYLKFIDEVMDKPISFYAFEMLYWCGLRMGELFALTPKDFDFKQNTVRINKSYQRIDKKDVITDPKTPKSVRTIVMPQFLAEEMQDCIGSLYGIEDNDRIFDISKNYLHREMDRGSKAAGIKRIRIHDLRHSHVSMLVNQGFTAVDIANRVGHESIILHTDTPICSRQRKRKLQTDLIRKGMRSMSERALDEKGRWRCITVSFRMSPEENAMLNTNVYLSGFTKQDYIIACVLKKEIVVRGSPRTYKALKNTLCDLMRELKENGSYTDEQRETLQLVVKLIEGFKDNAEHP